MTGRGDGNGARDRAVTVQIGAVILFGFLIVALSTYQATVVPDQNREIEFLHNQEVQTDMVELSSSITATGRTGDAAPATVKLGTRYPSRAFFVNPPPASGRVQTVDPPGSGSVSLENIDVESSAGGEANDYWDIAETRNKSTRFVVYEPRYENYRAAPTTRYESGVAFNRFSNGANLTLTDQRVVEDDRITLVAVSGDLSQSGVSTVSVDPEAVSTVSRRERVNGTLNVTIPTTLNATRWEKLLAEEMEEGWVNGTENAPGGDAVTIELNDSRTYALGIAAVHVGSGDTPDRTPAYLDVEQRPSEMTAGTTREVVVEVRDGYGNPMSGVEVNGGVDEGPGSLADDEVLTDGDGRAVFEYTARRTEGEETLRFSYNDVDGGGFDASSASDAAFTVEATEGGAGTGDGTASSLYDLQWDVDSVTAADGVSEDTSTDADILVNRSIAGDAIDVTTETTDSDTGEPVSGVEVDYASNTSAVARFAGSNGNATTDDDGRADVTVDLPSNGTAKLYAAASGAGERLTARVVSGGDGGGGPTIDTRVDDLTRQNGNQPVFIGSYSVSNTNSSFERVEVSFLNQDNNAASDTLSSTESKAGLRYSNGYGSGGEYAIVFEVIYTDAGGTEYVAESETISDVADAQSPTSENADLGGSSTAAFTGWTIDDLTQVANNQPRYDYSYDVSSTGSFSEVRAFALNLPGNGESGVLTFTSRSQNNQNIQFSFGANQQYRVGYVIRDANGAVVAVVSLTDTADGSGTYTGP
ncbi:hypothetical protein [Halobaculum magnesiiphilum]|uniref:Big-1 domain-containing protein n=1 Tax=Halobaculum magnesiiphilum TaxID=1017351 RepID=A0A8T8WCM7_9EURY|nr:hypothetical protein [Halobaculum magnesiiphilum]QZP37599.1 hypothetical protein K6T50_15220 [Halobaculum magnesiiphilum]